MKRSLGSNLQTRTTLACCSVSPPLLQETSFNKDKRSFLGPLAQITCPAFSPNLTIVELSPLLVLELEVLGYCELLFEALAAGAAFGAGWYFGKFLMYTPHVNRLPATLRLPLGESLTNPRNWILTWEDLGKGELGMDIYDLFDIIRQGL